MTGAKPIARRIVVGGLLASATRVAAQVARPPIGPSSRGVAEDFGEMLMLGFLGSTAKSSSARRLADHIAAGRIGGVCFVGGNVGSREDVIGLIRLFSADAKSTPLIAIDHEGGSVQRLTERHGVTRLPSARVVADSLSPDQARALYAKAATELARIGFNVNLAPVVDLYDPASPTIGRRGRAFGRDPAKVAAYAEAFIDGFQSSGVQCALKHFPGGGSARGDSHDELPDISSTWSRRELQPFRRIIDDGQARIIMSGHFRNETTDPTRMPTSLSRASITGLLRGSLGYTGTTMTDDLDMKAVRQLMGRRETVIRAIAAGNDLLMILNQEAFDPDLPQHAAGWVSEAIANGDLAAAALSESADRVRRLKQSILIARSSA